MGRGGSRLTRLDAFTKTVEDARVRTTSGGIVTIMSIVVVFVLVLSEFNDYRRIIIRPELVVDKTRGEVCLPPLPPSPPHCNRENTRHGRNSRCAPLFRPYFVALSLYPMYPMAITNMLLSSNSPSTSTSPSPTSPASSSPSMLWTSPASSNPQSLTASPSLG